MWHEHDHSCPGVDFNRLHHHPPVEHQGLSREVLTNNERVDERQEGEGLMTNFLTSPDMAALSRYEHDITECGKEVVRLRAQLAQVTAEREQLWRDSMDGRAVAGLLDELYPESVYGPVGNLRQLITERAQATEGRAAAERTADALKLALAQTLLYLDDRLYKDARLVVRTALAPFDQTRQQRPEVPKA